ncbi:MAG: peroxiredoxin-like family protein, partial [Cyanobacteria bacterium J06553_1]
MDTHSVLSQAKALQVSSGQLTSLLETVSADQYTLVLIWPQLGDFDTLEYAWWIERDRTQLQAANIEVRAIAIGDIPAGQKFCTYTDFPSEHLYVDPAASLHQELELYPGLGATLPGLKPQQNGYLNLLLMCAGI